MNNHYINGQIDLPLSQLKKVLLFYFLAFGMNPEIGGPSPPQVEKCLSHNFNKNICSCVENERYCSRIVNISNVTFTLKNI